MVESVKFTFAIFKLNCLSHSIFCTLTRASTDGNFVDSVSRCRNLCSLVIFWKYFDEHEYRCQLFKFRQHNAQTHTHLYACPYHFRSTATHTHARTAVTLFISFSAFIFLPMFARIKQSRVSNGSVDKQSDACLSLRNFPSGFVNFLTQRTDFASPFLLSFFHFVCVDKYRLRYSERSETAEILHSFIASVY